MCESMGESATRQDIGTTPKSVQSLPTPVIEQQPKALKLSVNCKKYITIIGWCTKLENCQ